MPPQRRLIRKRPITIPTLKHLPRVRDQVPTQARRMAKDLRTQRTIVQVNIVRVLRHVRPQVDPQRLPLREPLVAVGAVVRLLPRVRHQVPVQDLLLREALLADLALERPLAGVDALVAHQRRPGREPLLAHAAAEAALLHVHGGVPPQLDPAGERLGALGALEDFQLAVFVPLGD